jgi:hypothetical protein
MILMNKCQSNHYYPQIILSKCFDIPNCQGILTASQRELAYAKNEAGQML